MNYLKLPTPNQAVLLTAMQFLGVKEIKGDPHNKLILDMWLNINIKWAVTDEFAWCAAAHNCILKMAECKYFESGLARKSLELKSVVYDPLPGDSVIFKRGDNPIYGHVGIFIRFDGDYVICLGGNQADEFKASKYHIDRVIGYRRPEFIEL